jgi:hypothetical protein
MLDRDWHEGPCATPQSRRARNGSAKAADSDHVCAAQNRGDGCIIPATGAAHGMASPIPSACACVAAAVRLCLAVPSPGLVAAAALVGQVSCAGAAMLRSVNESNRARVCISSAGGAPAACAAVRAQSLSDAACLLGRESMCAPCVCSATLDRPAPPAAYTAVSLWPSEHTTPSFPIPRSYCSFRFFPPRRPFCVPFRSSYTGMPDPRLGRAAAAPTRARSPTSFRPALHGPEYPSNLAGGPGIRVHLIQMMLAGLMLKG